MIPSVDQEEWITEGMGDAGSEEALCFPEVSGGTVGHLRKLANLGVMRFHPVRVEDELPEGMRCRGRKGSGTLSSVWRSCHGKVIRWRSCVDGRLRDVPAHSAAGVAACTEAARAWWPSAL